MRARRFEVPLIGVALLVALSMVAAQPQEPADDPLPQGALVRFGVTRPILRKGPAVALIPPAYKNFLAPTMTGGIRRYDLGTGRPLDKKGIVGPGQVVISANGKRAAVARPGSLAVVEVATGQQILAVTPPDGVLIVGTPGVSLSADGSVLAYGGRAQEDKGEVVVWHVDKNEQIARLETAQAPPVFPTLSLDGRIIVTHGPPAKAPTLKDPDADPAKKPEPKPKVDPDKARIAQVWELPSGNERFKAHVTGMGGVVVAAAFSPDADLLALSAGDGPVDLWDARTGQRLHTLLGRKGQGVRVAISPDGKTVASVGPDYRIQRWGTDGTPIDVTDPPTGILVAPITGLTFADNERAIAWLTAAQFAVAWEAPSGKLLSPVMDHAAAIRSIAMPEGKDPVTSGYDARVFRWELTTGQLAETIQLHPARLPGQPLIGPVVGLSADGTRGTWQRTPCEIFDIATGDNLFIVPPPSSPPAPVKYLLSPDGMKLITLSRQAEGRRTGMCVIWDLATQKRVAEFEIPGTATTAPPSAALSPDGTRLVLLGTARRPTGLGQMLVVAGFDVKTGKKLGEAHDATGSGTVSVNMTVVDDTWAVIASSSGRVFPVDYANGQVGKDIEKLPTRGEPPLHGPVVFSPDGKRFATGVVGEPFTTYGVRVYDWPERKALHTFIGHAGPVTALRFSADSQLLATGAEDTSVIVWDLIKLPQEKGN